MVVLQDRNLWSTSTEPDLDRADVVLAYTRKGTFLNTAPAVQQAIHPVFIYDDAQLVNDVLYNSSETGDDDSEKKASMDSDATWAPSESEETDVEHCPGVL